MKKKNVSLSLALSILAIFICIPGQSQIKNVIFMIGDGMGLNQVYAAQTANGGTLNMEQFPVSGLQKTFSASDYITDSAAGGTALACGTKTNNYMVGMNADSVAVESILTLAGKNGKSTGIVVTSSVEDATPGAFYAHQPSRKMKPEIAVDLLNSNVDIIMGGGKDHVASGIVNGRNVIDEMKDRGYQVVYQFEDAEEIQSGKILGLFANDGMITMNDGRGDYLPEATEMAIRLLNKNPNGFFLMVEGSQIDWGAHQNNQSYMISETLDFDKAVGKAIEFAKADGHTLVIVTADHETGGTAIASGNFDKKEVKVSYTTNHHTGTYVPVFAFGPGAENFTGVMDNTSHKEKLKQLMKLGEK